MVHFPLQLHHANIPSCPIRFSLIKNPSYRKSLFSFSFKIIYDNNRSQLMHTTKGGLRCLLVRQSNYFFAVFMSCGLCPSSLSGRACPALQLAGRSFSSTFSSCFSLLLQGYVSLPFCLVPFQNCACFQKIKCQYQLRSIAQKTESLAFIKK